MATCTDCIHYEVCERKDGTSTYTVEDPSLNVVKEINFINCGQFKGRSKFIELPCNIGDIVYRIFENASGKVIAKSEVIGVHSKNHNPCLIIDGWQMQPFNRVGKTVFFTEEEAEQALRERNENWSN